MMSKYHNTITTQINVTMKNLEYNFGNEVKKWCNQLREKVSPRENTYAERKPPHFIVMAPSTIVQGAASSRKLVVMNKSML